MEGSQLSWVERYVSVAGGGAHDGTSEANAWTLAEAIAGAAATNRVNIKAGTYTLSAAILFNIDATSANAIWWRGYNSTIGDLDSATVSTNFPYIDGTGGDYYINVTASNNWFSNLKVRGAVTTTNRGVFYINDFDCRVFHNFIEGTANDADSRCVFATGNADNLQLYRNRMLSHATAAAVVNFASGADSTVFSNMITGGVVGVQSASGLLVIGNLFRNQSGDGLNMSVQNPITVMGNTFYNIGGDGIEYSHASCSSDIINNVFSVIGGYAIKSSGATSSQLAIRNNLYHSLTSGQLSGVYEDQQDDAQTDSGSPFVNAAGGDFTLASGSNARLNGVPSVWLDQSFTGSPDIGAVHATSGAGGGGAIILSSVSQTGIGSF